jgi:hypothetical protein
VKDEKKVFLLALGIILALGLVAAIIYFTALKKPAPPAAAEKPAAGTASPAASPAPPAPETGEPLAIPSVGLDQSDPVVREFAGPLTSDPRFARWIQSKELVRKFVAAVDNVANGLSPKSHVDFFSPSGGFKVMNRGGRFFVDASDYSRYDPVAEVFSSLNTADTIRFYRGLKPLINEAYRDLGYPDTDFDETLVRAMAELLEIPVVEGPVRLEKKVVSYAIADETLEALSQAQKQLLRMGPKNVREIQGKIRELAAALGVAESRLPSPRTSTARNGRP